MPLIEQTMTEKNLAAHRANARQSHGAVTPAGKENARAANLRHGYYSRERDQALRALGEDPAELDALIAGTREQFRPVNAFQTSLTDRIAHLQWRIQRAERMQESLAVEYLRAWDLRRHAQGDHLKHRYSDDRGVLERIQSDAQRPDFYTWSGYIADFNQSFRGDKSAPVRDIRRLLHRLEKPQALPVAAGPLPEGATDDESWRVEVEDADGPPAHRPKVPIAEGMERDGVREELCQHLALLQRVLRDAYQPDIAAHDQPLDTVERDNLIARQQGEMVVLRRDEDSCFRQFWRLTNLLMKLQKEAPGVRGQGSEERSTGVPPVKGQGGTAALEHGQDGHATSSVGTAASLHQNSGASGYVAENAEALRGTGVPPVKEQGAVATLAHGQDGHATSSGGTAASTHQGSDASGYVAENAEALRGTGTLPVKEQGGTAALQHGQDGHGTSSGGTAALDHGQARYARTA